MDLRGNKLEDVDTSPVCGGKVELTYYSIPRIDPSKIVEVTTPWPDTRLQDGVDTTLTEREDEDE